ncbi:MAG: BsuBI/PstI family type II restriction endonuclease [Gammaproteobacteria bacterium]
MKLEASISELRKDALAAGSDPVPSTLQGVTKDRIRTVLRELSSESADRVDAIFALLDDSQPSWFSQIRRTHRFCDGACIAHLACHIGILQRGQEKLDREGRDYWIKPLRDIGAVEPITLVRGKFEAGHPVAKSRNSAYRLESSFKELLLEADEPRWRELLAQWINADSVRQRLQLQARSANATSARIGSPHSQLIQAVIDHYIPHFLAGYEIVFIDDGDGDRITPEKQSMLARAGLSLTLGDAMPDILLWNPALDSLWVVEAVTSDGEVDKHKVNRITAFAERHKKSGVRFTTAYGTWREAAARQGKHKNVATQTFIWIQEDASKHFLVEPCQQRPSPPRSDRG